MILIMVKYFWVLFSGKIWGERRAKEKPLTRAIVAWLVKGLWEVFYTLQIIGELSLIANSIKSIKPLAHVWYALTSDFVIFLPFSWQCFSRL